MRKSKILGRLVALAVTFWLPNASLQPAVAANQCNSSAGKTGNINLSSKVRTSSVVLCGDWSKVTKSAVTVAPKKPVSKPAKPSWSSVIYTHSVEAAPDRPRISAPSASTVSVSSPLLLKGVASSVIRYRYLLRVPTQIKFTPIAYFWRLSDGKTSNSKSLRHRVARPGSITANLKVTFSVSFRLASGGNWRSLNRTVYLNARPVTLKVGSSDAQIPRLRFVHFNCLQRNDAPGC